MSNRKVRTQRSVIVTLALQLVTIVCGLILPKVLLNTYGSEAYGATASIAQFLSYITLLEGGIGGVARASLYTPLAKDDREKIAAIVYNLQHFFRTIGYVFIAYAIALACSFKFVSHIEYYNWASTAALVLAISVSTFGQYFIGISYSALLQADQRVYIVNGLSIITTVLNTIVTILMIHIGSNLIIVKLVSSLIFVIKPLAMWLYVKTHYKLPTVNNPAEGKLDQKWAGLGHHLAYYIHSNTDVSVLTLFANLRIVSVYSVYHMVTGNIQSIVTAFTAGMESVFGDMLARNERNELHQTFSFYETLVSIVCLVLFGTVYMMIVPFVKLYTIGITDVNYDVSLFAILITTASLVYCLRIPYQTAITAGGHFKQTQIAAYGEAGLNLLISVLLVWKFGLVGVAIGTIAAVTGRMLYSVIYLSHHILHRSLQLFTKRMAVNTTSILLIVIPGILMIKRLCIATYLDWVLYAIPAVLYSMVITVAMYSIFYRHELTQLIKKYVHIR